MNPKLCKRYGGLPSTAPTEQQQQRTVSIGSEIELSKGDKNEKTSVRDAALLLSIADICKSEIKRGGLNNLWRDDLSLPRFPSLGSPKEDDSKLLSPRTGSPPQSLREFMRSSAGTDIASANRLRSVSFDSPTRHMMEEEDNEQGQQGSPTPAPLTFSFSPLVTPHQAPRRTIGVGGITSSRKHGHGLRPSKNHGNRARSPSDYSTSSADDVIPSSPGTPRRMTKALQGPCPPGLPIKNIHRKKFSWKNYPEVS